ncbi:MAG: hypothetical protein HC854_11255 [Flavobacterium sp.]|nr:hypothetical protein [Flavobacterium sp.]
MQQLKDQIAEFEQLKIENDVLKYELETKNKKVDELYEKIESLEKDVSNLMSLKKELATAIKQNSEKESNKKVVVNESVVEPVNNTKIQFKKQL